MQPASSSSPTRVRTATELATEDDQPFRPKRRRTRAGRGVQQVSAATGALPTQQQPEASTTPSVQRRYVTGSQSMTEQSSAPAVAEAIPEPMDVASVAAATSDDEESREAIIAMFTPDQQTEIRENLTKQSMQQILDKVRELLKMLKGRDIELSLGRGKPPIPSLFSQLKRFSLTKDAPTLLKFFDSVMVFFSALNTKDIKNTSCLSSMLDYSKKQVIQFATTSEDNLRQLASNPYLKQIASMCNRKGVPSSADASAITEWECWKIDGKFSLELFRTFASMMSGKGLLKDQARIEELLAWACWQLDDEFSMELLRTISSMMTHQGYPDRTKLEEMLSWDCWKKINGKFSLELLRIFSSMGHGKGLLENEHEVEAILACPCWQVNGEFSLELLRSFASMMSGRDLLDLEKVQEVMAWDCWKEHGTFNLDRLRIFSSMMSGRGIPKEKQVESILFWPCWQVDDQFSLELLRTVAYMHRGKGLLERRQTEAFLSWPCWLVDGKFSLACVRIFALMMGGHGYPEQEQVEAILGWPCWQIDGKFSLEILQVFSAMMGGKGLPDQATAEAFVAWLPSDNKTYSKEQTYLRLACCVFTSTGVPDPEMLTDIERALRPLFAEESTSDHESSDDSDDEPSEMVRIKALALFCAASTKWQMNVAEIKQFLAAYNFVPSNQTEVRTMLDTLLQILDNHGQAGIRFWLKYHAEHLDTRDALTGALLISAPLALAKFALKQLPESEWQKYIALCKNLTLPPNKEQWQALKPLRDQLDKRFAFTFRQRMMLEVLWPQWENNRLQYSEKIDALLASVPTAAQLAQLQLAFGYKKMQRFLEACLIRQNIAQQHRAQQNANETIPEVETQTLLLEGLLVANYYFEDHHQEIPQLCFSKRVASSDGQGVIIDGEAGLTGQQRLWHFIAAMLIELQQTEYQFKRQQIRILPPDSEPVVLPKPEFACMDTGFVITNWSLKQLTAFFQATEFNECWYKNPDDKRDTWAIRREERLQQMQEDPENTTQAHEAESRPRSQPPLLAPSVIINIIKQGLRLKPAIWSSLEHYANNGQLSNKLCRLLAPVIRKEHASTDPNIVPNIVKKTVEERLKQSDPPQSQSSVPTAASQLLPSASAFTISAAPKPHATFAIAMKELARFRVLGSAELGLLAPWRDQMTYSQLIAVITKMSLPSTDLETELVWRVALESKRRDPLGLNFEDALSPSRIFT